MRVLVTGGLGFIGRHTVEKLVRLGHVVTVLDNQSMGARNNLPLGCAFIHGDVRDGEMVDRYVQNQDVVVHLAAFTSVPESFECPSECFEVNVHGTLNIIESVVRCKVRNLVFASSSAVYSEEPRIPKDESMCPGPSSPYAVSKLEGEHVSEWYHRRKGLHYTALRYFNVYGPGQVADSDYAAVVPIFIDLALSGKPLIIHGDGRQTRDFVYIEDVAEANVVAALGPICGVYNVGTGEELSIFSLAQKIVAMAGSQSNFSFASCRPGDVVCSTANIKRISRDLGWSPNWCFSRGLNETIEWSRKQWSK